MTDITIPREAEEAVARKAYELFRARASNTSPPWEFLPVDRKEQWLDDARTACLAMLRNWPGMEYMMGDEAFPFHYLILPLTESNNDKG